MTASRSPISSATSTSTTRPTARTIATAPTTTSASTAAPKGRPRMPTILERRRRLRRNQLASLLLAQGVPLILAGDEVGNSQGGNNNAYCQDNEIGWVNWSGLGSDDDMTALRRRAGAAAAAICSASLAPLAGGPQGGRRATTCCGSGPDARRDEGGGLEFPGGPLPRLRAGCDRRRRRTAVRRVQRRAGRTSRSRLPAWPGVERWTRVLDTHANSVLADSTAEYSGAQVDGATWYRSWHSRERS